MKARGIAAPIEKVNRVPELDGLRGLAILLVLGFHFLNNQLVHNPSTLGKYLGGLTSIGWVGVDLFFVLSGFLIGGILIRNRNSPKFFATFYLRRLARIVPNYYLLLIIFLLLSASAYFLKCTFLTATNVIPNWSYFLMLHNFFMAHFDSLGNSAISPTWSIAIEEQFYLIFPLIVFFIPPKWLPKFLIACIVIAPLIRLQFHHWIPQYVLLGCRMDSIAMGALVAVYDQKGRLKHFLDNRTKWFFILLVTDILICGYLFIKYGDLGFVKNTLFAVFFACCLSVALVKKNWLWSSLLRIPVLRWVGTISYSLYLFHYLILGMFQYIFSGNDGLILNTTKDVEVTLLALMASLIFSWMVYQWLETPFVQWGKRFNY